MRSAMLLFSLSCSFFSSAGGSGWSSRATSSARWLRETGERFHGHQVPEPQRSQSEPVRARGACLLVRGEAAVSFRPGAALCIFFLTFFPKNLIYESHCDFLDRKI